MDAGIGALPLTGHADADGVLSYTSLERGKKRLHSPPDLFSAVDCNAPLPRFITGQDEAVDGGDSAVLLLFSDAIGVL